MAPFFIISIAFGLIVGSFLNVLISRLPNNEKPTGRSRCPHCKRNLLWHDLIPLLSFALLRGRCRFCHTQISWQYPVIEILTALLFITAAVVESGRQNGLWTPLIAVLRDWIMIAVLLTTAAIDLKHQIIFDAPLALGAVPLAVFNIILGETNLWECLLAGILGASFFGLQYALSKGKWIGGGDIRLGAFLGISLTLPNLFVSLALAYIAGSVVALPLLATGRYRWKSKIAFGTFLSLAGIITMLWGEIIKDWYLHLIIA